MKKKKQRHLMLLMVGLLTTVGLLSSCDKTNNASNDFEYFAVQMVKDGHWSIIDKDGKEVVKEEYPEDARVSFVYDGVYWVKMDGVYQLYSIDSPRKPISNNSFTRATHFRAGVAVASVPDQPICIVNTKGKIVAQLDKDIKRCYQFTEDGYAVFHNSDDKKGVIDTKGNIVIKPIYEVMETPSDELVLAKKTKDDDIMIILDMKGDKQGTINLDKYRVSHPCFHEGKLIVRDKHGDMTDQHTGSIVLDKTGNKLFTIRKDDSGHPNDGYHDGYLDIMYNGEFGVVDDKGETVIRTKYDGLLYHGNGLLAAYKDGKWGIIDVDEQIVIDYDYDDFSNYTVGGNFLAKDNKTWVLVDKNSKKELASFYWIAQGYEADEFATFGEVEGVVNEFMKFYDKMEQMRTVKQVAKDESLSPERQPAANQIWHGGSIGNKFEYSYIISFDGEVVSPKTHQENVSDGWFTYNRTVVDGWEWTTALQKEVSVTVKLTDYDVPEDDVYQAICQRLANGRKKINDNTFSKIVKVGGKTYDCRTKLTKSTDGIEFKITYTR